jgi:putative transposase
MKRKRYLIDDSSYPIFITTTISKWLPVFQDSEIAIKCLDLLESLRAELNISIFAYALMPSHFHGIIKTSAKGDISIFMKRWKALSAKLIMERCSTNNPDWVFIFQQCVTQFKRPSSMKHQIWQPRFDDFAIRTEKQFLTKLNYIHGNPIKHGLAAECQDYPYSSIHDYLGGKNRYITVELMSYFA